MQKIRPAWILILQLGISVFSTLADTDLQIISPPSGTVVAPGQIVDVTVQVNDPARFTKILLAPAQLAVESASEVHFSVTLDDDIPAGPLTLVALATASDTGTLLESSSLWHLVVQRPTASLYRIDVNLLSMNFDYVGDSKMLTVTGRLNSWEKIPLSGDPALVFSVSPQILSVDPSGQVTALAPGKGTIRVQYGGDQRLVRTVDFQVRSSSVPGDLDNDGDVDSEDLDVVSAFQGSAAISGDARDLDHDGSVTTGDYNTLSALCTRVLCSSSSDGTYGRIADTTLPTVVITNPVSGAVVQDTVVLTASASDNAEVAGVQFKADGANIGEEDTSAPYSVLWDTRLAYNGQRILTAMARDSSDNTTVSEPIAVIVTGGLPLPTPTPLRTPTAAPHPRTKYFPQMAQ